ncbi:hypothetical protein B0H14DRAFT_2579836 [Mycena olivaceomarginata]|nr:hypothetical protein B0H14DRAFT_2579836 [Mycena olivaceomarginata]
MKKQSVFVVGAGVVGLSTAIRVLEAGYDVTLFAEVFPTDPKTVKYTSFWAGAICNPGLGDSLSSRLEKKTMHIFVRMVEEDPNVPIARHPVLDTQRWQIQKTASMMPNEEAVSRLSISLTFGIVSSSSAAAPSAANSPRLSDLLSPTTLQFEPVGRDGIIADTTPGVSSVNSRAFVNCTGLGARSLGGVNGNHLTRLRNLIFERLCAFFRYNNVPNPRGTVLLRAPWITSGIKYAWKNGDLTYIIPRGSGVVVLGGTFQVDDWYVSERDGETDERARKLRCAATSSQYPSGPMEGSTTSTCLKSAWACRPSRKDGVRVETGWLDGDKRFPVVHNYGHGGSGYESSWASAELAVELLQTALEG